MSAYRVVSSDVSGHWGSRESGHMDRQTDRQTNFWK